MKPYPFPLIPFSLFFALGCSATQLLLLNFNTLAFLSTLSLLVLIYLYASKKTFEKPLQYGVTVVVFAFLLGLFAHYIHYEPNQKKHYTKLIPETKEVLLKGLISDNLKASAKNSKHILQISSINNKIASGKLLLFNSKENTQQLIPGNEIIAKVKLIEIPKNYNPAEFNYANYLANQNIFDEVFLKENDFKIVTTEKNKHYHLYQIRKKLLESFSFLNWNTKTKAIINALLFGQKSTLDKETYESFSNAGVIHILAISGLHVGILFLFLNFILKPLKKYKNGKLLFLVVSLFVLWSFALLTGMAASVTRAVLMFSLFSIGTYLNKQNAIYNSIAISALVLLVYNPNYIFDIGFQMSYAAVLAIVLMQPFFKQFYFSKNKIIRYFTDLILVSLAAQIGVLPLSIYYFNQFPVLFLVANLVVIPIATALLFLGLLTLFFNFTFPIISSFSGKIIELLVNVMTTYIDWVSSHEAFCIKNISFTALLCFSAYIVIAFFLFTCYHVKPKNIRYFLLTIIGFQLIYGFTKMQANSEIDFVIFNAKNSIIAIKNKDKIDFYCNDPDLNIETIANYKKEVFSDENNIYPMQNTFVFQHKKVLVLDSIGVYPKNKNADIVLLTENSKVNLQRLIEENKPKAIVADNSNKSYLIAIWKATCSKEKIPFHATAEKGFYSLK